MKKTNDEKSIHIDKNVHKKMKDFCDEHGYKIKSWLAKIIVKEIKNVERNNEKI